MTAVCVCARAVLQRCFQQQAGLPTNISLARPRLQRWRPSQDRDRGHPARMRVLVSVRAAPLAPLSTLSVLVLTTSWGVAQVLQECLQQQPLQHSPRSPGTCHLHVRLGCPHNNSHARAVTPTVVLTHTCSCPLSDLNGNPLSTSCPGSGNWTTLYEYTFCSTVCSMSGATLVSCAGWSDDDDAVLDLSGVGIDHLPAAAFHDLVTSPTTMYVVLVPDACASLVTSTVATEACTRVAHTET